MTATLNFHFCMGRFASVELYKQPAKKCSTCGMVVKNPKCCHDEVKFIKLQNVHQHSNLAYNHEMIQPSLTTPVCYSTTSIANEEAAPNRIIHSPPLITHQDACLLNSVFRI